jgi:hypothetical protein
MLSGIAEYFSTRRKHFQECWKHAQHHRVVASFVALVFAYSVWTEYVEPFVQVPELHIKKLPLSWALATALFALFFVVLEGSYRLRLIERKSVTESGEIRIEITEVNLQSRLKGHGKNLSNQDPTLGWDVFLDIRIVSSLAHDVGIADYSLSLNDASGKSFRANGPLHDLEHWHKDVTKTVPQMWGDSKTERATEPLADVTLIDPLRPQVFAKGTIHFQFDSVPASQIQAGTLTLTLKDAKRNKHYAISDGPRPYSGAVWPNDV